MKHSEIVKAINSLIDSENKTPVHLSGPPGGGKTTAAVDVARTRGIPTDVAKSCIFRPSLHDPVDVLGLPTTNGTTETAWATPRFLHDINRIARDYGFALLILDELNQAVTMMQNALAGLLLDRRVGEFVLDDNVYMVSTGNRQRDKAGSSRLMTQLANRLIYLDTETSADDWCKWALSNGIDPLLVGFIRFRPDLLHDFDPSRTCNATPRSWEAAAKLPVSDLPLGAYREMLAGTVGEGPATEYVAFREVYASLPSKDSIVQSPDTAPIPGDPAVRYATVAMLVNVATENNLAAVSEYMGRLPPEFDVLFHRSIDTAKPSLAETPAWQRWATTRGADVLL